MIKVIWGSDWDALFAKDTGGFLLKRMDECVDGDFQNFKAKDGAYLRKEFFGKYPELLNLVKDYTDEQLGMLHRGGHDPAKIYNAYKRAIEHKDGPTVILAMTVKGYGLGSAQARNATHSEKKLADEGLAAFVKRFDIPVPEQAAKDGAFYRPEASAPEMQYMQARRKELGGYLPQRVVPKIADRVGDFKAPALGFFKTWTDGSKGRSISTTMGFVNMLNALMKDKAIADGLCRSCRMRGARSGWRVRSSRWASMRRRGRSTRRTTRICCFPIGRAKTDRSWRKDHRGGIDGVIYRGGHSVLELRRTVDSLLHVLLDVRLPADRRYGMGVCGLSRGKGFLMGGTAGRTTMLGEGLQHQDGHSIVLASTVPTCRTYDPAFVYEMAVVIQDGIQRMYEGGEDAFYYVTMYNEDYVQMPMPEGVAEGIIKGMYKLKAAAEGATVQLFGSGPILNEVLKAQTMLADKYKVHADVWSVTSYVEVRREALAVERWNRLHPAQAEKEKLPADADGWHEGTGDRGERLHEECAGWSFAMAGHAAGDVGYGRIWPERQSRTSTAAF